MTTAEQMREVKQLMSGIEGRLANDDVFTMRRTLDELVLAMNILVGLVEGHRHRFHYVPPLGTGKTGPMQAMDE